MFDLALSVHGDLIFGGNRDLAGVSGTDLLEQRIRLRLKIFRGSWLYDETKTLGSQLYRTTSMSPSDAHAAIEAYVREALRDMNEITVEEVIHIHEHEGQEHVEITGEQDHTDIHQEPSTSIKIGVLYTVNFEDEEGNEGEETEFNELIVTVPIGGGGF